MPSSSLMSSGWWVQGVGSKVFLGLPGKMPGYFSLLHQEIAGWTIYPSSLPTGSIKIGPNSKQDTLYTNRIRSFLPLIGILRSGSLYVFVTRFSCKCHSSGTLGVVHTLYP